MPLSVKILSLNTDLLIAFCVLFCRTTAGSGSLDHTLPPEENNANRLVEQIQELIEFLANR